MTSQSPPESGTIPCLSGSGDLSSVSGLQVGGFVLTIGMDLTVLYFSLAAFFTVHAKALDRHQKAAQKMGTKARMTQPSQTRDGREASRKGEIEVTVKAVN
jgi:hypothetical protein